VLECNIVGMVELWGDLVTGRSGYGFIGEQ
jgi:hypothetical protein